MRGSKLDVYEGGIHVPGFINWPGKIQPSLITDYTHIVDWFPTLASIIKYNPQTPIDWDGKNIIPMLIDNKAIDKRDLYWLWATNTNRWALRYGDWKIVKYGQPAPAVAQDWGLYNLKNDPQEQSNVASSNPQILEDLHKRYLVHSSKDIN